MTRFKDFGIGDQDPNATPITFKLHGEEFHCIPEVQGKVMLELIAESAGDIVSTGEVMTKFFSKVLKKDSLKKFNELLDSSDKIVSIEVLSDITSWLVEEYSNRPSERSEES